MSQHLYSGQPSPSADPLNQWLYQTINNIVTLQQVVRLVGDDSRQAAITNELEILQHALVKRLVVEFTPFVERSVRLQTNVQMREIREAHERYRDIQAYPSPVMTLILSGMPYVLTKLSSLKLDINNWIIRLLWRVFLRGFIEEYKQFYRCGQGPSPPQNNPVPGTADAQAWLSRWSQLTSSGVRYFDDDTGIDWESIADSDPAGDPERVVDRIHARICWQEAMRFLQQQKEVDQFIFMQRAYHKLTYKEIAAQLGQGHTDGAVKMQYHRLRDVIVNVLRQRGLVGEGEDSCSEGGRS